MPRAMIVEPDESVRRLQRTILRQHASIDETVELTSVEEALPLYSSEHFDFALVDISRPGDSLSELLHVSRKEQKSPVIAFTTGRISRETLQVLVSDHVFAVFPKPFDLDEVIASVRSALDAERTGMLYPAFFGFLRKDRGGES
jgi:DNA-binding NtrC family response regulator